MCLKTQKFKAQQAQQMYNHCTVLVNQAHASLKGLIVATTSTTPTNLPKPTKVLMVSDDQNSNDNIINPEILHD